MMFGKRSDSVVMVVGQRRARRSAFTLIELLVVIAIIAMLIAILLPSLEAARRSSKRAACMAHIKNIATSSRVYEADDPSGWGIPVHPGQYTQDKAEPTFVGAYEWGGKSGIGRNDFLGHPEPYGSKYGTPAGFGPATRPMNDILYSSGFKDNLTDTGYDRLGALADTQLALDLFKCPGDEGPPRGAHCPDWIENTERSSYDHFGNSYAANIFMIGSTGGGTMKTNSPYMRSITRVPTPARTLYYEENIGRWAWSCWMESTECRAGIPSLWGIDPGPTKAVPGWHGHDWTFNRSFCDGHAEYQRVLLEETRNDEGYYEHYWVEMLFPPDNQGSACIIVRGPNWQKDTMPQKPLDTGLNNPGGTTNRPSYEDCVQGTTPP